MTTTSYLWLAAILGAGLTAIVALFVGGWLLDRWAAKPMELGGAHRAEAPLPPAHVEAIRLPMDEATSTIAHRWALHEERTEEMPRVEEPVVHVEVSEVSTPLADVFVPLDAIVDDGLPRSLAAHITDSASGDARHLDRIDGALRGYRARLDATGANSTIDRWLREGGYQPGLIEARRAAYPHCDDPSMEIPAADLAEALAIVAAVRAGAS
jgi:hypothetical protein